MRLSIYTFLFALFLVGCSDEPATKVVAEPVKDNLPRDEVVELFRGEGEPAVKDAVWTQDYIFKVGVFDNGSNRSGYAEYVCSILNDYGFKGRNVWVQVIDYSALMSSGKWDKLGESRCK